MLYIPSDISVANFGNTLQFFLQDTPKKIFEIKILAGAKFIEIDENQISRGFSRRILDMYIFQNRYYRKVCGVAVICHYCYNCCTRGRTLVQSSLTPVL